jgi:hypothetical protein
MSPRSRGGSHPRPPQIRKRASPPAHPATVLCSSRILPLGALPLAADLPPAVSGHAFTRSIKEPRSGSCCLYAGRRLGSKRVPPRLIPGRRSNLVSTSSFRLSTRQRQRTCVHRSSSRPAPDAIESRLFPRRSPQRSSANAAVGGLKPPPAGRLQEGQTTSISSTLPQSAKPPSAIDPPPALVFTTSPCRFIPALPNPLRPP